jgi:diguanylate cyclase (GGDEF)-like protein
MKITLLILLISLLTNFCVTAKTSEETLTPIDVQLKWRHQFQFSGYYAAISQGYYREAGLDVNLLERLPGPAPIDRLIVGQVDYAIGGVGALAYRINGVPLVALAATFQHTPSVLISRYGNIMSLKGKKIMLTKGIMNAEITTLLQQHGLTPSDYQTVPSVQSIDGFVKGEFDAYNGYIANEVYQLNERKIPHYIFSPRNDNDAFYGDILLTTEKRIRTKLDEVKSFRAATIKGWEYAITHIDETISLIQTQYNSQNKTTEQLNAEAQELIKLMHAEIVPIGYMHEQRWLGIANSLQQAGHLTEEQVNLDGFIYSHYTRQSFFIIAKDNIKLILISLTLFIAPLLLIYNRRLKVKVQERTHELNLARQQAEQDARTDPLTGIANRRFFMETFAHDLAISRRNHLALSLIYIDIDWFKKVNDTYGHTAGDAALKTLAEILTSCARASDTPARIGGEEFSIICLEKNQKNAINLAERIRREVENTVFTYQDIEFKMTLSLGVTSVDSKDTLESVLNKCDSALYKAKELGRNQVQWI